MNGYFYKYKPTDASSVTGCRRVYEACRAGIKNKKNVEMSRLDSSTIDYAAIPFEKSFLEDANYLDSNFRNCSVLLLDIIPYYDSDFIGTQFWWLPKFRAIQNFEHIFTPSEWTKKTLVDDLGINPEKVSVHLLGYDKNIFKPKKVDKEKWLMAHGIPINKKIIGHVSYGYTRKNLQRVFKAISDMPDVFFVKIGTDPLTPRLVADAGLENQVKILPPLSDSDLADFYNVIDIFVFPSTSEGFGLPALEAQACGCPTVTSNTTALAEILGPGAIGIDPYNIRHMAEAIAHPPPRATPKKAWLDKFDWKNLENAVSSWLT